MEADRPDRLDELVAVEGSRSLKAILDEALPSSSRARELDANALVPPPCS